jgi:hypothetical protein
MAYEKDDEGCNDHRESSRTPPIFQKDRKRCEGERDIHWGVIHDVM